MLKLKTLIFKELRRFFTDRRMLSTLLLPGVFIYVLYTVIGNFSSGFGQPDEEFVHRIVTVNFPEEFAFMHENFPGHLEIIALAALDETQKTNVQDREIQAYMVFEAGFYETMRAYSVQSGVPAPNVEIFYNSASSESSLVFQYYAGLMQAYERSLSNKFNINATEDTLYNLATAADFSRQFVVGLVPFLLIVFLFSGSQAIAVESIAGEKERNTIGTLLATPTSRSHIALGKIIALSITALVSATSSFLGVMLALPQLVGDDSFTLAIYGFNTYLLVFVIIVTTVLIFVVLLSLVSAYAKSIKEAMTLAAPLMIVIYLMGATSLIGVSQTNTWFYLIPVYNSIQSLTALFDLTISIPQLALTVISNLIFLGVGIALLRMAFDSEKMMFNK